MAKTWSRYPLAAVLTGLLALVVAAPSVAVGSGSASGSRPDGRPAPLPAPVSSPPVDAAAPYTPLVRSLIDQLLPDPSPTRAQLVNANRLFEGRMGNAVPSCHGVGETLAPSGTTPGISPMCWVDAVGINVLNGPNRSRTTASPSPLALGATFDTRVNNAWGQVEGVEGRRTMMTGLYGPEVDVLLQPDWQRGIDTLGEDPLLTSVLGSAQVDGIQGRGLMAQVKHLAGFSAAHRFTATTFQDQALHEIVLTPFERTLLDAGAASIMCAYESFGSTSTHLPATAPLVVAGGPYGDGGGARSWPLNQIHQACEQPLTLNHILRGLWGSDAFVGSDYPAIHSVAGALQGVHQEFPAAVFLGHDPLPTAPIGPSVSTLTDPTGDTCAAGGRAVPCTDPGARHVGGIPGPGCPANGCDLVSAVQRKLVPLALYKQMLALVLYQEERFGLLGCDDVPRSHLCTNPGGVAGDRSGTALLPDGPVTGRGRLGTTAGDAGVVQRAAEEGAVLLKNSGGTLPITASDLRGGVAVTGSGAEYLIAAPSNEAAVGRAERTSISPLRQLRALSGRPSAITYTPARGATGRSLRSLLRVDESPGAAPGLRRVEGPEAGRVDPDLNFTTASRQGALAPGAYRWEGVLRVTGTDTYTFRIQSTASAGGTPDLTVPGVVSGLRVDGVARSMRVAASPYCGRYYAHLVCVRASRTNGDVTQSGLANQQSDPIVLGPGDHRIAVRLTNTSGKPASIRLAADRAEGDVAAAARAARGKAMAVVFADDRRVSMSGGDDPADAEPTHEVATLDPADVRLIRAVAAANPHTVVVLNTATPVIVSPWADDPHVTSILEMWNAGSEGGTATARLLLGLANPSGHTPVTWPRRGSDTISAYDQPRPLYPGDTAGRHPERFNGAPEPDPAMCAENPREAPDPCVRTEMTQGIFSGYRFFDRLRLRPRYPFGYGRSYTTFRFGGLRTRWRHDALEVRLTVTNTGSRSGAAVPQVYLGPGRAVPDVQQAVRALVGFGRVTVPAHHSRHVRILIPRRQFQHWSDARQSWRTTGGSRRLWVGSADRLDLLPLRTTVHPAAHLGG